MFIVSCRRTRRNTAINRGILASNVLKNRTCRTYRTFSAYIGPTGLFKLPVFLCLVYQIDRTFRVGRAFRTYRTGYRDFLGGIEFLAGSGKDHVYTILWKMSLGQFCLFSDIFVDVSVANKKISCLDPML